MGSLCCCCSKESEEKHPGPINGTTSLPLHIQKDTSPENPTVGVHGNPSTRKDAPIHQELSHSTAGDPKDGSRNVSKGLKDTPYNPSSERFTMGTGQITEEPQELPSSTPTELHHPEGSTVIKDVLVGDQPYSENPLRKDTASNHKAHTERSLSTPQEFHETLELFVRSTGLQDFFPQNDRFLDEVAKKAAAFQEDHTTELSNASNITKLTLLSLYHVVFYCDDSTSMRAGSRADTQSSLVSRIARIATKVAPDEARLDLHFINRDSFTNCDAQQVEDIIGIINPNGGSALGTSLRKKILNPLVYDIIQTGEHLKRPILIFTITDGSPTDERYGTFKKEIVQCREALKAAGYPPTSVRFCVSQIGNDTDATRFLDGLANDTEIEDVVRCTTNRLDERYEELRKNEKELENWLLNVLTSHIVKGTQF